MRFRRPGATPEPLPSDRPPDEDESVIRERLREKVERYCPSWMRDCADDVVQIAWLRLAAARDRSERNRNPGPSLLARVAYCATVDEIRRNRRRREVPAGEESSMPPTMAADPARAAGSREIGRSILTCLAKLLRERRLAVTLYLQGHTGPETGAILGWTLKKAENMIFRGLADLRRCLARKGVTP